jgi:DNA-binding IscR family transcriptional regulator
MANRGWDMKPDGGQLPFEFSRSTVLATNGILALASAIGGRAMRAEAVAKKTGSDPGEMSGVLSRLEAAGIVERDGSGPGTYRLSRQPDALSLLDVAEAVGEPFDVCRFLGDNGHPAPCLLEAVSRQVRADVVDLFRSRTVGQLMAARA